MFFRKKCIPRRFIKISVNTADSFFIITERNTVDSKVYLSDSRSKDWRRFVERLIILLSVLMSSS